MAHAQNHSRIGSGPRSISEAPNDCWPWKGRSFTPNGYGAFYESVDGQLKGTTAHRVAFLLSGGVIPDRYTVDHVKERGCVLKSCCNPAHLEAVTLRENILRSDGPAALNARKTHCPKGHPYDEENTEIRSSGARRCRVCSRVAARAAYARKREERLAYSRRYRAEHLAELRHKDAERQRHKRAAAKAAR